MRSQSRILAPGGAFVFVGVLQAARPARGAGSERQASGQRADKQPQGACRWGAARSALAVSLVSGSHPAQARSRALARVVAVWARSAPHPSDTVPQRIPGAASPTGAQCPSVPHGTATAGRLANEHGGKGQTRRGGLECRSAHALREWAAHAAHTERPQRRRLTRRPRAQSSQADSKDASRGGRWGACPRGCGCQGDSAGARAAYARRVPRPKGLRGMRLGHLGGSLVCLCLGEWLGQRLGGASAAARW